MKKQIIENIMYKWSKFQHKDQLKEYGGALFYVTFQGDVVMPTVGLTVRFGCSPAFHRPVGWYVLPDGNTKLGDCRHCQQAYDRFGGGSELPTDRTTPKPIWVGEGNTSVLKSLLYAASKDEKQFILNGVCIDEGKQCYYATDSRRLDTRYITKDNLSDTPKEHRYYIPSKIVELLPDSTFRLCSRFDRFKDGKPGLCTERCYLTVDVSSSVTVTFEYPLFSSPPEIAGVLGNRFDPDKHMYREYELPCELFTVLSKLKKEQFGVGSGSRGKPTLYVDFCGDTVRLVVPGDTQSPLNGVTVKLLQPLESKDIIRFPAKHIFDAMKVGYRKCKLGNMVQPIRLYNDKGISIIMPVITR
jgi:hypothetical protein